MHGKVACKIKFKLGLLIIALMGFAELSQGASGPSWSAGITERAVKRESSRWTLQDWMAKKETMRWQDIWLSMNSGSPFEGSLYGHYKSFASETDSPAATQNVIANFYGLSAWAQMVGLEVAQHDNKDENILDQFGSLNLRLLGSSIQSSNLILHYGVRTRYLKTQTPATRFNNTFTGLSLQIYLQKYFGLEGKYQVFAEFNEPSYGKLKGHAWEANLFIDFKAVRIFGGSTFEQDDVELAAGGLQVVKRIGTQGGLKIFF